MALNRAQLNTKINTQIRNSNTPRSIQEQEVAEIMTDMLDYLEEQVATIPMGPQGPSGPMGMGLIPNGYGLLTDALIEDIETAGEDFIFVVDPEGDDRTDTDVPVGLEGDQSLNIIGYSEDNGWTSYGQFTGTPGPQGPAGQSTTKMVKINLTSADILSLKNNPKTLLPASLNKIYIPKIITLEKSDGNGYTGVALLKVNLDYHVFATFNNVLPNNGMGVTIYSNFQSNLNASGVGLSYFANKPLLISTTGSSDPIGSNSTATIYLEYLEIDLTL